MLLSHLLRISVYLEIIIVKGLGLCAFLLK